MHEGPTAGIKIQQLILLTASTGISTINCSCAFLLKSQGTTLLSESCAHNDFMTDLLVSSQVAFLRCLHLYAKEQHYLKSSVRQEINLRIPTVTSSLIFFRRRTAPCLYHRQVSTSKFTRIFDNVESSYRRSAFVLARIWNPQTSQK